MLVLILFNIKFLQLVRNVNNLILFIIKYSEWSIRDSRGYGPFRKLHGRGFGPNLAVEESVVEDSA